MKVFYCLYKLTKLGNKKYLRRNGTFRFNKTDLTYKSLKKQKVIAVRSFIEGAIGEMLFVEEF